MITVAGHLVVASRAADSARDGLAVLVGEHATLKPLAAHAKTLACAVLCLVEVEGMHDIRQRHLADQIREAGDLARNIAGTIAAIARTDRPLGLNEAGMHLSVAMSSLRSAVQAIADEPAPKTTQVLASRWSRPEAETRAIKRLLRG